MGGGQFSTFNGTPRAPLPGYVQDGGVKNSDLRPLYLQEDQNESSMYRITRNVVVLTALALSRDLAAEELVLDVVNGYTKTLPQQVKYVVGATPIEKAVTRTADLRGGRVTLLFGEKPALLTVMADGFEPVKVDLRRRPSSIGLRPLGSVRAVLPATSRDILRPGSSVRVSLSNSHFVKPLAVAPVTVGEQGLSFRVAAGTWRGAALIDERHVVPFFFSVAPGESVAVDTLAPLAVQSRFWAPVREDGSPVTGVEARWHFAEPVSRSQAVGPKTLPDSSEPRLTALCEELLAQETRKSPNQGVLRMMLPDRVRGRLSFESPGFRILQLGHEKLPPKQLNEPSRIVLRNLPLIKIAVPRSRSGDDSLLTAAISATPSGPDGESAPKTVRSSATVKPGGVLSTRALADADHRIELRDAQSRLQGLIRVSRADRDWGQDVITRNLQREDRTITGTVFWGNAPLVGARVVALLLRNGEQTGLSDLSVDDFSLSIDKLFETGDETDANGRFSLPVFVPGVYRVMAYHPDLKYGKASPPLDLREAKDAETEIGMRDRYVLLEVHDEDTNEPIVGARAVIRSKSKLGVPASRATLHFESDADGLVRAGDLFVGDLEIELSAKGYRQKRLQISPSFGAPIVPHRDALQKGSTCDLQLMDETGAPLPGVHVSAVGAEASQTIFPQILDLGEADDSGILSTDAPADGFPHLLASAAGKKLKFIPLFFAGDGCSQSSLVFQGQSASILPELRTPKGAAIANAQVALATGGVFLPWNALAEKGASDGLPASAFLLTGRNGEIQSAAALEAGEWQASAFKYTGGNGNELLKRIGSFELPLTKPTVIVVTGGKQ